MLLNTLAVDGGVGSEPLDGAGAASVLVPTLRFTVRSPYAPLLSHARTTSWCDPVPALMLPLTLPVVPALNTVTPSR